jgi:hypothetical protein
MAALAARGDGTLELISADAEGRLLQSRFSDGAWTMLGPVSDTPTSMRPALVISRDSSGSEVALELVCVGEDGVVWHQRFQAGSWGPTQALRSPVGPLRASAPPAIASGPKGGVELVLTGEDGLFYTHRHAGSWIEAHPIKDSEEATVALALVPLAGPSAALELFTLRADGAVTHRRLRDGRWTRPSILEGLLATSVSTAGR